MSSSNSCLDNISRSPPSGIFRVLHKGGYAKSSTGSVNPLTSSLFILKIKNLLNVKYLLSDRLHTRIVNKFSCPSCDSCYVDETSWHFSMRVHEHMSSDRSSHVYKHLQASESRRTSCNLDDSVKGGYWSRFMENKMAVSHFTDNKFGISRFTRKNVFIRPVFLTLVKSYSQRTALFDVLTVFQLLVLGAVKRKPSSLFRSWVLLIQNHCHQRSRRRIWSKTNGDRVWIQSNFVAINRPEFVGNQRMYYFLLGLW